MPTLRYIVSAFIATFAFMFFYEYVKEQIHDGNMTRWESHWITIGFTSSLVALITWRVLYRYGRLQNRIRLAEEKLIKLALLRKIMGKVNHHLNNLAQNMQVIELEMEDGGSVSPGTVQILKKNIRETGAEMKRLSDLDDPDRSEAFEIKL